MNSQTAPHASSARKVYHLSYSVLAWPTVVLVGSYILALKLTEPVDPFVALICAGALAAVFGIAALMLFFGVRLVVSDEGIGYYNIGFRVISPWENVASLAKVTFDGSTTECLLLRSDGLQMSGWFRIVGLWQMPATKAITIISGRGYAAHSVDIAAYCHVIPVGYFKAWTDADLWEEIHLHAPQAFTRYS